ncbi:methyltransferase domain-containing protein (plasmid) [Crocosphaera watsonii WH 8501]|uniref:Methyltransferase domain-containing protein n=2 Tax=Crocosphaera watsonii TaxID=263511 RepID=Q4BX28_CROWT|nr:methyltransferase domain-containing protein [Crocosphaera watsonii]EAM48458.1 hypothetical protein CwatDRAFT_0609 [Crocosphaera watsonii WH 8501]CCQ53633.1 blr5435; unknown protein [Crocosphaera watsonii WH 8502]
MTNKKDDKLFLYYEREKTLPTFARFKTVEDLDKYESQRARIFTEKLKLPTQLFKGIKLLEFGPDSGENSLAFARWGASLTLVEPNSDAHVPIKNYLENFGLKDKLDVLVEEEISKFTSQKKYQFIDAEGFIYTFRPESIWLNLFKDLLDDQGFCLINYYEASGGFLELILKLIHAKTKTLRGLSPEENAWQLFESKWNSIPHTRSFKSWVMDVLENPFVRYEYFFDASELCQQLFDYGYSVYSSWPNYQDTLSIYWHKMQLSEAEKLNNNLDYIARSRLGFLLGKKLFLTVQSSEKVKEINDYAHQLTRVVDHAIDDLDSDKIWQAYHYLEPIKNILIGDTVLANSIQDKQEAIKLVETLQTVMQLLTKNDSDDIEQFCNTNPLFIKSWGIPYHFIVFQKQKS